MTDPLLLLIDALATFRLARLIAADTILDPVRSWLLLRWPGDDTEYYESAIARVRGGVVAIPGTDPPVYAAVTPSWFGRWLECVWCSGMWVAVGVVAARVWWDWWQWPALVLALSAVAGLLHTTNRG